MLYTVVGRVCDEGSATSSQGDSAGSIQLVGLCAAATVACHGTWSVGTPLDESIPLLTRASRMVRASSLEESRMQPGVLIYVCVFVCACARVRVCMCVCARLSVCLTACLSVCLPVCLSV